MLTQQTLDLAHLLLAANRDAALLLIDEQLRLVDANAAARMLLRMTPGSRAIPAALHAALLPLVERPPDAGEHRVFDTLVGSQPLHVQVSSTAKGAAGSGQFHLLELRSARASQAQEESLRWAVAADLVEDGLWDWNLVAGTVWLSDRWKAMLGHAPSEIGERDSEWSSRIHPDDAAGVGVALQRHFDGLDDEYRHEFRLRHRDGRWIRYLGRGRLVTRTPDGRPLRMIGTGSDVTALRAQQERQRRETVVLRQAMTVARAGSWVWHVEEDRHEFSDEFLALFGAGAEQMDGPLGTARRFFSAESFARIQAERAAAVASGMPYEIEVDGTRTDGTPMVLRSHGAPLRDPDGRVRTLVGLSIDVTAARQATRGIARQALLLDRMSRLAAVGAWEFDVASGALSWSAETWRIHGMTPRESPPVEDAMAFYPGDAALVIAEAFRRALETGTGYDLELPLVTASGAERWVRTCGEAESADGRCVRVFGAIQDITERKLAEVARSAATDELNRRNEDLQAFASIAAHDIKEPARKVEGFLGMALRVPGPHDPRLLEAIERSRAAVSRMLSLVDDLLLLARTGSRAVDLRPVDLDALLDDVLSLLEGQRAGCGARIVRARLPTIDGDIRMLRQMLQNLLGNALKFRDPEREPEVRVSARDDFVSLAPGLAPVPACTLLVEDNGVGFEQRFAAQIFEPFKRLHGRGRYDGTGIGLALVRRIVERHHGAISAHGDPGHGSRFAITLPLGQPDAAVPGLMQAATVSGGSGPPPELR